MSCTTVDALDRRLVVLVKQIEQNYTHLSSQERIRIERWVDKLVSSECPFLPWKRDRDLYVSLLNYQVILTRPSSHALSHTPFFTRPYSLTLHV